MAPDAPDLAQDGRNAPEPGKRTKSTPSTPKKRLSRKWMPVFLRNYARFGIVKMACEAAGIDRTTAYLARTRDPAFAEAWEVARDDAIDELEQEALRRGLEGSDTLLIFMLKALRPDKYRERIEARSLNLHRHEHTVTPPDHPEPTADAIVEIVEVLHDAGKLSLPPAEPEEA